MVCCGLPLRCLAYRGCSLMVGLSLPLSHLTYFPCVPYMWLTFFHPYLGSFLFCQYRMSSRLPHPESPRFDYVLTFWPLGAPRRTITRLFSSGTHVADVLSTQRSCGAIIPVSFLRFFGSSLRLPNHVAPQPRHSSSSCTSVGRPPL